MSSFIGIELHVSPVAVVFDKSVKNAKWHQMPQRLRRRFAVGGWSPACFRLPDGSIIVHPVLYESMKSKLESMEI